MAGSVTERRLASPLLLDALSFAVERHGGVSQARKGTAFPYVLHPLRVAEILRRHGYEDELIAAGMLHDTIEDAEVTVPRSPFAATRNGGEPTFASISGTRRLECAICRD